MRPTRRIPLRLLGLGAGLLLALAGCETTAVNPPSAPALPTDYAGEAFAPSSFVARPILISAGPDYPLPRETPEFETFIRARIAYVVDATGRVVAAQVVSTNNADHAHYVLHWLASARFVPGRKDETAVAVRVEQDFDLSYGPVRDP